MAMRGNAAGDEHHRRTGGADQFVVQAQLAGAGVAGGEHGVDAAAANMVHIGARRLRATQRLPDLGRGGTAGEFGAFGKAHGGAPMGTVPSVRAGDAGRADAVSADARPANDAGRNHLPVDAQVPAGFGTARERAACAARSIRLPRRLRACPSAGLDGCGQSGHAHGACQSLYADEAINITNHHKPAPPESHRGYSATCADRLPHRAALRCC